MSDDANANLKELTVDLLAAFVSNNIVSKDDLPALIASTHAALAALDRTAAQGEATSEEFVPAVSARRSLSSREHIVSMIDGKPYRMLKRHLSNHGLTPDEYRARYKLPASYPMVAPAYSERRSATAKRIGLGRKAGGRRKAGRG